ncbi:hypothetical protein HDK77DRAFT_481587 [Phyllosticta capitalensis]
MDESRVRLDSDSSPHHLLAVAASGIIPVNAPESMTAVHSDAATITSQLGTKLVEDRTGLDTDDSADKIAGIRNALATAELKEMFSKIASTNPPTLQIARLVFSSFIDSELDLSRDHCVSVRAQIYALKKVLCGMDENVVYANSLLEESSHSMDPIKRDRMTTVLQLEELKKEIDNLIAVYKSDMALLTAERVHREGLIRRAAEAAASKDWAVYLPLYCDRKERGILLHEWNTASHSRRPLPSWRT